MHPPLPSPGAVVRVRQRSWLVSDVVPGASMYDSALVRLACLDDDAAGDQAEVLWSYEVDAQVVSDIPDLVRPGFALDDPRMFGAYLHAMRWHTVTSTDKRLLQAPFRAGIDLKAYQLDPLRKALELPRVNLFIADDVGLGKTVEAGLVLQELILRQRIDRVLVVCPPAVTLQWKDELEQRFGLNFAVYDREFVSARRRERGFGVNPWTTHNRFIVSYALLRGSRAAGANRTLELLRGAFEKPERTLLILDECHQAAPASEGMYPVDSRTTLAVRELAPLFEHRLFLSATPHNGHSHSFASLLHLLDPQRFMRGVPIGSAAELAPVMVRRLKRHLRHDVEGLPERKLVDHVVDPDAHAPEVKLGELLAQYDKLYRQALSDLPPRQQAARALVVINLHKRLLSSIEAFQHTLTLHAKGAHKALAEVRQLSLPVEPDEDRPADDEADDTETEAHAFDAGPRARALLDQMQELGRAHRSKPDRRVLKLVAWIRENLAPQGEWNDRRVIVFTEYEHTLTWLRRALDTLLQPDTPERIGRYTGRLSEIERERIKTAFNTRPSAHPLRILLATDAAREGINLQAHCTDLFHFDLPWNPGRIEQRNGRIDRVLQPAPVVRCHYFIVPERPEDRVLDHLVRKLERIRDELGSLSEVISARLAARLEAGLRDVTPGDVDRLATPDDRALAAQRELEGEGADLLRGNLEVLRKQLERSQAAMDYRVDHLRDVVDLGLKLTTGTGLLPVTPATDPLTWTLPPLDASWTGVVDAMRARDAEPDPRKPSHLPPVRPVAFQAAHRLDADAVQLHLGHPLVKRLMARFRAQGFAAHDLSRVTLMENQRDPSRRVVLFGRLALFGHGATRLHEEVIAVAARCTFTGDDPVLEPYAEKGEASTIEWIDELLATGAAPHPSARVAETVRRRTATDFAELWARLQVRADERRTIASKALRDRGDQEATAMDALLTRQRAAIEAELERQRMPALPLGTGNPAERSQYEREQRALKERIPQIAQERATQTAAIRRSYAVVLHRFEPVGLAYLWTRD